jgi:hypothetical protein
VFRAASACSFELALMPEPQRHAGTDRGQDEQNQPPVGRHESGQQQDAESSFHSFTSARTRELTLVRR